MNVLTTTWRQLVRRRLWPVAVLLLAALVAVPVMLARDPAPVTPPEPAAQAPASQSAKTDDALAEPVVAKVSSTEKGRRRRVLGVRKDPFTPAVLKHKKKAPAKKAVKKQHTKTTRPTRESTPSAPSSPSSPSSPAVSGPSTPAAPAPKKKVYAKDSLIVRFGDATGETLKRVNLLKLAALPNDADSEPLLIYTGLTDHGKKAVFLVDESLDPSGDGHCSPHPATCEKVELAKGETEFFDVIDPDTGDVTAQYELDLVDIK
jgi:hypothetical protein